MEQYTREELEQLLTRQNSLSESQMYALAKMTSQMVISKILNLVFTGFFVWGMIHVISKWIYK